MDKRLAILLVLQLRGKVRRLGRAMGSVRGALLVVFGTAAFVLFLMPSLLQEPATAEHMDTVRRYGPLGLAGICLMILLFSGGERAISFTPAEINLLFPAPISRRQLLLYKIAGTLGGLLISTVIFTIVTRAHQAHMLAAFVGLFLTMMFLQLLGMVTALVICALGEHAHTRRRKIVLLILFAVAVVVLWQVGLERLRANWLEEAEKSPVIQALLTPLRWLVETAAAERIWPDLVQWAALSIGVNLALLLAALALDAHYLETAAAASEKIYARVERMRKGGTAALGVPTGKPRLGLPALPSWGGVGPIAWRQLTTALRSLRSLIWLCLIFGMIMLPALLRSPGQAGKDGLAPLVGTMLFSMAFFVSAMVPFDFRGDLDRMEFLKTLPLPAWRLALGQIVTPVILVSLAQWLVIIIMQIVLGQFDPILLVVAVFAVPINFILVGLDNLLFLWYPARLVTTTAADMQHMGRQMLVTLAKLVGLVIALLPAGLVGTLLYFLTRGSWPAAGMGAWFLCSGMALGLVPLIGLAFRGFDVARDMPG